MSTGDHNDDVGVADTMTGGERPAPKIPSSLPIETERYQLIEVLGRGGAGEVHKAFDPRLGRHVALKIMREATREQAARLVSEARAQARVEHPNVCKVYGVGELNGLPFIALQYIEGKTLQEVAPEMTREERIAVMRDVSDALHAAHRQGLVHRDVKPTNILVERTDEGWHPYVTDFGIAREIDTPSATKTGVASGTPLYMAPEQARGQTHRIDRRTDVYGLGATLYQLLSGRHPFEGDTPLAVIFKLLHEEPAPLRELDPAIPVDLETVTMKCLEKEPARRYDSARALADDLQAWIDGEPILARRSSVGYRLIKRARKHVALLSIAAVLLVAATTLGGYAMHARRVAAEQAELAHAFGQEVERTDAIARYAALLPLHDTRRERALIAARLSELERRMAERGGVAEGPGRYALGRGYLVLERPDDARRELERAWQRGYRTPEVSYALGLALSQLYQRALVQLQPGDDAEVAAAQRAALARELREPALAYLKRAAGLSSDAPEYAEGLIALHERRFDQALDKARAAQARVPWMYEAHTLEGDIRLTMANERWAAGGPDEALAELERAGAAYRNAASIGRSDWRALHGDCRRLVLAEEILVESDREPGAAAKAALDACGRALVALPDDADTLAAEIDVERRVARYQVAHSGDPVPAWTAAVRLGEEAGARRDEPLLIALGYIEHDRANWELDRGEDPRPRVAKAISTARAVLERNPSAYEAYHLASDTWEVQGDWEYYHGLDPRAAYETAATMGQKAYALSPHGFRTLNAIGLGYLSVGMWEATHGRDPRRALADARGWYDKVVAANPNVDYGYNNLCMAWQTLGEWQAKRGDDPTASYERALDACKQAAAVDPGDVTAQQTLGNVHVDVAAWQRERGVDPAAELALGRAALQKALALDPFGQAFTSTGQAELVAARWAMAHGQSPEAHFAAAKKGYEGALGLNKQDSDALCGLAELYRVRAEWAAAHHRAVDADAAAGIARATQALEVNAKLGIASLHLGALWLVRARVAGGEARRQAATRAGEAIAQALASDGNLARLAQPLREEAATLAR